jgi:hypothetical protein
MAPVVFRGFYDILGSLSVSSGYSLVSGQDHVTMISLDSLGFPYP